MDGTTPLGRQKLVARVRDTHPMMLPADALYAGGVQGGGAEEDVDDASSPSRPLSPSPAYTPEEEEEEEEDDDDGGRRPPCDNASLLREVDALRARGDLDNFGVRVSWEEGSPAGGCAHDDDGADGGACAGGRVEVTPQCDQPYCRRTLCGDGRKIGELTRAGNKNNRDWRPFWGWTVCSRCYNRFIETGSIYLKRDQQRLLQAASSAAETRGTTRGAAAEEEVDLENADGTWSPASAAVSRPRKKQKKNANTSAPPSSSSKSESAAIHASSSSAASAARLALGGAVAALPSSSQPPPPLAAASAKPSEGLDALMLCYSSGDEEHVSDDGGGAKTCPDEAALAAGGAGGFKASCSYEGCLRVINQKRCCYRIVETTSAGDRNWAALVGMILCKACYMRFTRTGSLEGTQQYYRRRRAATSSGAAAPSQQFDDDGARPPRARSSSRQQRPTQSSGEPTTTDTESTGGGPAVLGGRLAPQSASSPAAVSFVSLRPSSFLPEHERDDGADSAAASEAEPPDPPADAPSACPRPDVFLASTAGAMELDALEIRNARSSVLKEMPVLLYLSTAPPAGMAEVDFDVVLCSGWGINVVCKVPNKKASATAVRDFVHELCFLVSIRCKAVSPPASTWLDGKRKTFVCKRSRCIPAPVLGDILEFMGVKRVSICMYGLGIRVDDDMHLFPFLFLNYGLREGQDEDDGHGSTTIRVDFSNTYRFPGLWNVCGDSNTCTTFPEGADLCRGYGSIELPALSVNAAGMPFFNMMPPEELQGRLPALGGRVLGFKKFKFYKPLTHTRRAVSQINYNRIATKCNALRAQWASFKNMCEAEHDLHSIFASVKQKLDSEGRGDDPRFQLPVAYFEGQRAEGVWEAEAGAVTAAQLRELAETARQAQLFIMSNLGWQKAEYSSVVKRSLAMAKSGATLMQAADNLAATVEQRNFLAVAYNTHMASGPVVRLMSFRKSVVNGRSRDGLLQGEKMPWHDCQFYERKSRQVMMLYRKTREITLKEIRHEALIVQVPWDGEAGAAPIFCVVAKDKDSFLNLKSTDGKRALSLSEAALHLYAKDGKEWRRSARLKRVARRAQDAQERLHRASVERRDCPWPFCPPNMEALALMHAHTTEGDRWAKQSADGMPAVAIV